MHLFSILAKTIMCESHKREATEGNSSPCSKIHNSGEKSATLQSEGGVSLGDLIWVKHHGNTWWPAQVVDENSVSESSRPGSKSQGKLLVRLYGSYEYLYVDPVKCRSGFKKILEHNNGNCYDILDKSLEEIRSHQKSSKHKGQGSKATARKRADASKDKEKLKPNTPRKTPQRKGSNVRDTARSKASEQDDTPNTLKRKIPSTNKQTTSQYSERTSSGESPKSARRTRVMQGLGLMAPSGSPFDKNGLVKSSLS